MSFNYLWFKYEVGDYVEFKGYIRKHIGIYKYEELNGIILTLSFEYGGYKILNKGNIYLVRHDDVIRKLM